MACLIRRVESAHVASAPQRRMDFLCDLLDNPGVLAADSSPSEVLALTAAIALPDSAAHLGSDVDCRGRDYRPMARRLAL